MQESLRKEQMDHDEHNGKANGQAVSHHDELENGYNGEPKANGKRSGPGGDGRSPEDNDLKTRDDTSKAMDNIRKRKVDGDADDHVSPKRTRRQSLAGDNAQELAGQPGNGPSDAVDVPMDDASNRKSDGSNPIPESSDNQQGPEPHNSQRDRDDGDGRGDGEGRDNDGRDNGEGAEKEGSRPRDGSHEERDAPRRAVSPSILKEEERRRGRRLFGGLVNTLSRSGQGSASSMQQKRRQETEARMVEKARERQQEEMRRAEQYDENRRKDQLEFDERVMRKRHDELLDRARFLRTRAHPPIYWLPKRPTRAQRETIEDQLDEAQEIIDNETAQFEERKCGRMTRHGRGKPYEQREQTNQRYEDVDVEMDDGRSRDYGRKGRGRGGGGHYDNDGGHGNRGHRQGRAGSKDYGHDHKGSRRGSHGGQWSRGGHGDHMDHDSEGHGRQRDDEHYRGEHRDSDRGGRERRGYRDRKGSGDHGARGGHGGHENGSGYQDHGREDRIRRVHDGRKDGENREGGGRPWPRRSAHGEHGIRHHEDVLMEGAPRGSDSVADSGPRDGSGADVQAEAEANKAPNEDKHVEDERDHDDVVVEAEEDTVIY